MGARLKPGANWRECGFIIDEAEPDANVRVAWGIPEGAATGEELFSAGPWVLSHRDETFCFRFASPASGLCTYRIALFNSDFTSGQVYLDRDCFDRAQSIDPLEYPLDELLILNLLACGRGVELHACGVVDALGRGHLFVGQSGDGKTTMARLWEKAEGTAVLSDDRIILRKAGGRLQMYGTPWHGEAPLASPEIAPLARVYFLARGERNQLVSLGGASAVARLFACSFPPFYRPSGIEFTLDFLGEIVEDIPCYELRFIPQKSVVQFIQDFHD